VACDPGRELRWPSVPVVAKQLAPVANRPIVVHALERLRNAGAAQIAVAVCDETGGPLRNLLGDGGRLGIEIAYLEQQESGGLVPALRGAEAFADGDGLIVHPSDVVTAAHLDHAVAEFQAHSLDGLMLVGQRRQGASEAPDFTGLSILGPRAVEAALVSAPDAGLARLCDQLRADGARIETCMTGDWSRLGPDQLSLLDASRVALDAMCPSARIDPSARIESTETRGPVVIGARTQIRHSYIGPYSVIADDVLIEGAEIENSIILSGVAMHHVPYRVDSSIIGSGSRIGVDFALPRGLRLQLAEQSEVTLS
jgi:glucose-1-phosphate thymidylyltransferase